MSPHSLALVIVALWILQVGVALASPRERIAWTPVRKLSTAISAVGLGFLIALIVSVL